jgi:hypothetical protein
LVETEHVKGQLRRDLGALDELKEAGRLDDSGLREGRKKIAVSEANILRDLGLALDKAHKEEEASLRQQLDKDHAEEQVAFRQGQVEAQAKLRRELLGDQEAAEEQSLDRKVAEQFAVVKR